jgi:hypothetical protein
VSGAWQHLVSAGLLRDLLALGVAHVVAVPHIVTLLVVRHRRKQREGAQ